MAGKSRKEIAQEMPGMYIRYHHGIHALQAAMDEEEVDRDDDFVPRPWQQAALTVLTQQPNDRDIMWITDVQGGQGKTRLATHLIRSHGAIELSGKMADMIYAYYQDRSSEGKRAKIVIFDISRAAAEFSNHIYSMAEKLKGGRLFNTKYCSKMFTFPAPHVIIFSNAAPQRDPPLLSLDRLKETVLQPTAAQPAGPIFM